MIPALLYLYGHCITLVYNFLNDSNAVKRVQYQYSVENQIPISNGETYLLLDSIATYELSGHLSKDSAGCDVLTHILSCSANNNKVRFLGNITNIVKPKFITYSI